MNIPRTRREFLADVGRGMLVATVGCGIANELGLAPAFAADAPDAGILRSSPICSPMNTQSFAGALPQL